jgi:CDP-diacylglycerol--glycerol-3-phosphate 3-phosphatidyltransferase
MEGTAPSSRNKETARRRGDSREMAGPGGDVLEDAANLPNLLSLLRILAVPLIVWLLANPSPKIALVTFTVYFAATMTDILDGWLARKYGLITPLGKLLDPLADKLLVVSALIMLGVMDREPALPGWLLVIIVGRELAVTGLRSIAASEGIVLAAEASGKVKMVLQSIGVHALILHYNHMGISFHSFGMWMLVVGTAVGLWSAFGYHLSVFRELSKRRG